MLLDKKEYIETIVENIEKLDKKLKELNYSEGARKEILVAFISRQ